MAFAARATSAYPGAFPPAQIGEVDRVVGDSGGKWPRRSEFLAKNFRAYARAGLDPLATSFLDGSVLNNKPFAEALQPIRNRPAYRQVDRRLVYIDPDPVQPPPPPSRRMPGFFATLKGALSDLPRNEPIADAVGGIANFNERVRQLRAIVDAARPEIAGLVTDLAESRIDGPFDVEQIAAARVIAAICHRGEESPESFAVSAIVDAWAERRGIVYSNQDVGPFLGRLVERLVGHSAESAPPWFDFCAPSTSISGGDGRSS